MAASARGAAAAVRGCVRACVCARIACVIVFVCLCVTMCDCVCVCVCVCVMIFGSSLRVLAPISHESHVRAWVWMGATSLPARQKRVHLRA